MKLVFYGFSLLLFISPQQTLAKKGRLKFKDLQEIIISAKNNFSDIIGKPDPYSGGCFYTSKVTYGIRNSTSISDCDRDGIFDIQFDLYYSDKDYSVNKQFIEYEKLIVKWLPQFKESDKNGKVSSGHRVTIWSNGEVEIALILTTGSASNPTNEISIIIEPIKGK